MLPLLVTLQYVTDGKNYVMDRLSREEKGATAVEYGLLVGLVAIVLVVAITALNGSFTGMIGRITARLAPPADSHIEKPEGNIMLPLLVTLQYITDGKNHVMDRLAREEKGATAVEYGLLVGLVAIVLVVAITALNGSFTDMIGRITARLATAG